MSKHLQDGGSRKTCLKEINDSKRESEDRVWVAEPHAETQEKGGPREWREEVYF